MKRLALFFCVLAVLGVFLASSEKPVDILQAGNATAGLFVRMVIKEPLMKFQQHIGRFPTTKEGLDALTRCPPGMESLWRGPYVDERMPLDPWKRPYQYRSPGEHNRDTYEVWSLGADGTPSADDIGNWDR
jgi:general secretion pathway protein G